MKRKTDDYEVGYGNRPGTASFLRVFPATRGAGVRRRIRPKSWRGYAMNWYW